MSAPLKPKTSKKRAAAGEDDVQIQDAPQLVAEEQPPRTVGTVIGSEAEQYLGSLVPVFLYLSITICKFQEPHTIQTFSFHKTDFNRPNYQ
jgi:hypothetical protein